MFGLFKKSEEAKEQSEAQKQEQQEKRLQELNLKASSLNRKNSPYLKKMVCVPGGRYHEDWFAVFEGFDVKDDIIKAYYTANNTPPGRLSYWEWNNIAFIHGDNCIEIWHNRFIKIKNELDVLGFEIKEKVKQ